MIPSICTFVIKLTHSHIKVAMLMLKCAKCIIQYGTGVGGNISSKKKIKRQSQPSGKKFYAA